MKNKKTNYIGIILLFVLGLLILLYPTIANLWNENRAKGLMREYETTIAQSDTSVIDETRNDAINYNKSIIGNVVPDAFAYEEANNPNKSYEALLNIAGDGYMCRVEIPVIDVDLPVYHYTTEEVLEKGVGHLPGSSLPIGGKSTHSVLSAHRGLPSAKLFTDLDRIKEGDLFYIHVLNETLAYKVNYIKVIEPTDTSDLSIVENKDYVTLFTCTPYAVNSHRLLVRGERVAYSEEEYIAETNKVADTNINILLIRIVCVVVGILLALLIHYFARVKELLLVLFKKKKKHEKEIK